MSEAVRFYCHPCGFSFRSGKRSAWVTVLGFYTAKCPRCRRKCYTG